MVRGTIVDPWVEQEVRVGHPLPPVRLFHPTRIDQLELWGVLLEDQVADQKEGRVALHPSAVLQAAQAVQGVPQTARERLREDRVAKPVEGPAQPHPSAELQVARVGLQGDRAVKPEGPVAMRGESHWAEARGVHRMHPGEERTQAGLKRWLVGLSAKVVAREGRHPSVDSRGVQVA